MLADELGHDRLDLRFVTSVVVVHHEGAACLQERVTHEATAPDGEPRRQARVRGYRALDDRAQGRIDVVAAQRLLDGRAVVAVETGGEVHPEVGEETDRDVGRRDLLVPVGAHRAPLEFGGTREVRLNRGRAVELVVVDARHERLVAREHGAGDAGERILIGDPRRVRRGVTQLLEERQVQCGALAEEVIGGRRQLVQVDLECGHRGVAGLQRGRGRRARTRTSEPRSHGPRVGDGRGLTGPGG